MFIELHTNSSFGEFGQPLYYWTQSLYLPKPIDNKVFTNLDSACYFRYGKEYKDIDTTGWELIKIHSVTTVLMEPETPRSTNGSYVFRWWEAAKKMAQKHKKDRTYPNKFFG